MFRFILAPIMLGLCSLSVALAGPLATVKIVNGTPAASYPWMAAIVSASDNTQIFCGGQLIHPRYILTAAHCAEFLKADPDSFRVVTGRSRLTASGGIVSEIEGAIIYPLYDGFSAAHDIALLKLTAPVPGAVISLLTPEQAGLAAAGVNATILGWGTMDPEYPALPDLLQEASVPIWSDDACEARYGLMFKGSSMVCAGKLETSLGAGDGVDSCNGDSGGPLAVSDGSGSIKLAGVVSWGFTCGGRRYPGVYAEVAPYTSWIYSFPAIPPVFKSYASLIGELKVGKKLTCDGGPVLGDKPLTYSFTWKRTKTDEYSEVNLETISGETGSSYTLTEEDEEKYIVCEIQVENSGGKQTSSAASFEPVQAAELIVETPTATPTVIVEPTATPTLVPTEVPTPLPTIEPTPLVVDSVAPKASLARKQAAKNVYQLVFTAVDNGGVQNISRIEATSIRTYVEQCKVKGKRSTKKCTKTKSEFFLADSSDGSNWTIELPRRAQSDRYTLFVRAVDKAGNVQSAPTRVVLVVKQRR